MLAAERERDEEGDGPARERVQKIKYDNLEDTKKFLSASNRFLTNLERIYKGKPGNERSEYLRKLEEGSDGEEGEGGSGQTSLD